MTFDMQKARELREATRTTIIKTFPGQTGYGIDHSKYPDFKAMQEVCSTMFPAALDRIAELEAQNDSLTSDVEVWRIDRNAWMARYSRACERSRDLGEKLKRYQRAIK